MFADNCVIIQNSDIFYTMEKKEALDPRLLCTNDQNVAAIYHILHVILQVAVHIVSSFWTVTTILFAPPDSA